MVAFRWAVLLLLSLALPGLAHAQPQPAPSQTQSIAQQFEARAAQVLEVLAERMKAEEVFAPSFLADVSPSKLTEIARQLKAQYGPAQTVGTVILGTNTVGTVSYVYERALVRVTMTIDPAPPHKVIGLLITSVQQKDDTPEKLKADLLTLPGRAGLAITRLGPGTRTVVLDVNADQPFAIGSGFKLWVLAEAARAVNAGERRWPDVIALGPPSLPSGVTQDWPRSAPMTLHSLATLMISISDNTATDTLIRALGRAKIDKAVRMTGHSRADRTLPVITTTEAFALKMEQSRALRDAYLAAATPAARAKVLEMGAARLTRDVVSAAPLVLSPLFIDGVEWFASPHDIGRTMDWLRLNGGVQAQAILGVSKGFLPEGEAARFAYVGYKGGSETGVLSTNFLIKTKAGDWFTVTASWNNPAHAVELEQFTALVLRAVQLVR
jgi:hypothetical protein